MTPKVNAIIENGNQIDIILEKHHQNEIDLLSVRKLFIQVLEKQRIKGVLLGLKLSKDSLSEIDILETEMIYSESLENIENELKNNLTAQQP